MPFRSHSLSPAKKKTSILHWNISTREMGSAQKTQGIFLKHPKVFLLGSFVVLAWVWRFVSTHFFSFSPRLTPSPVNEINCTPCVPSLNKHELNDTLFFHVFFGFPVSLGLNWALLLPSYTLHTTLNSWMERSAGICTEIPGWRLCG